MEAKDLLVTPVYLIFLYLGFFLIRPFVTTQVNRKYFFPALTARFAGALALGGIYQFYYGGGDTFGYTTYGGNVIWEAFLLEPITAFKLIFFNNEYDPDTLIYASRIMYFKDPPTYFVVRVAGFLSLFTFSTYSAVAIIFAAIGFSGSWSFFQQLSKLYPKLTFQFAIALFFVPSVVFWGSGVMKDTLTLSAVTWSAYAVMNIFFLNRRRVLSIIILLVAFYVLFSIKIYILLCFFPAVLIWIFFGRVQRMGHRGIRLVFGPMFIIVSIGLSFFGVMQIGQGNTKYSIENIALTAELTAKDNSLLSVGKEGSGYNLGDYDFSPAGMLRKFFPAVWVTLFRPYLWEVNSPVMLLSALESLGMLLLTIYLIIKGGLINTIKYTFSKPFLIFCMVFTITFAFSVGISSGNFGSLVRYKIPAIPFFLIALFMIQFYAENRKVKKST